MFFCDHVYDADEAAGAREYDPSRRAPYYRAAAKLLLTASPVLPLGFERRTYVVLSRLEGFKPNPLGREYWNAWKIARR